MFKQLVIVCALISLMVSPLFALAQDDEDETKWVEFETISNVTISHPEAWFVADYSDPSDLPIFTLIYFANSEEMQERVENGSEAWLPGDKGVEIIGFPEEVLILMEIELDDTATPKSVAQSMVELFYAGGEDTEVEYGEPESIQLLDQPVVGIVPITEAGQNSAGVFYYFRENGFVVFGWIEAHTGEYDEEFQQLAIATALSFESSISAEKLMDSLQAE